MDCGSNAHVVKKIVLMVTCNASGRWGKKLSYREENFKTCYQQQLNMSCNSMFLIIAANVRLLFFIMCFN